MRIVLTDLRMKAGEFKAAALRCQGYDMLSGYRTVSGNPGFEIIETTDDD